MKSFGKTNRTIVDQGRKQVEALSALKPAEHKQKPKSVVGIFLKIWK